MEKGYIADCARCEQGCKQGSRQIQRILANCDTANPADTGILACGPLDPRSTLAQRGERGGKNRDGKEPERGARSEKSEEGREEEEEGERLLIHERGTKHKRWEKKKEKDESGEKNVKAKGERSGRTDKQVG